MNSVQSYLNLHYHPSFNVLTQIYNVNLESLKITGKIYTASGTTLLKSIELSLCIERKALWGILNLDNKFKIA